MRDDPWETLLPVDQTDRQVTARISRHEERCLPDPTDYRQLSLFELAKDVPPDSSPTTSLHPRSPQRETVDSGSSCDLIGADRAVPTNERWEDMKHPSTVWSDPAFADESLHRLREEYLAYLKGRAEAASAGTIDKYGKTLLSFIRSLEKHDEPTTLASLTPGAVNRWVSEQRAAGLVEDGIASRLSALKVFSRKYLYQHLELTTSDLLRKVPRIIPPERPIPALSEGERERLLACFDKDTYEDIRNRALIATYLATGLRFREVLELDLSRFDRLSGEVQVRVKGGRERIVRIGPRALKLIREYLKRRPTRGTSDRVWLREDGEPLGYWGGQSIFRRLRERSGVNDLHAHLLRHTFAQVALVKGAERAAVQDMLGHRTDAMSRRYAGNVRQETAARMMPEYAPI